MSRSMSRGLAAAILLLPAAGIAAEDPDATAACALSAWSTASSAGGRDIRAGPAADAPVIASLPPPLEAAGYSFGAEVAITGSRDGWFRIERATAEDYVSGADSQIVFEGEGWLSGKHLGLGLNRIELHAGPSAAAPVVARLYGDAAAGGASGPDSAEVRRLHACMGEWVEVEGTFLGAGFRGWAAGTCANQVTTCP